MSSTPAPRIRVDGDVVSRPAYPWTPTVHALLRHLLAAGLDVPEPIAVENVADGAPLDGRVIDGVLLDGAATGVETVRLVPGVAGADVWPLQATDDGLASSARLLRRVHDAARSFVPPDGAAWAFAPVPGPDPTILHGDPGPWNMAWRDGVAVGLFDWDLARPGPAVDDVAYALDYLLPFRDDADALRWHGFAAPPDRRARLRVYLEAYGLDLDPDAVVTALLARKTRTDVELADLASRGAEPQRTWVTDGFLDVSARHLAWARSHARALLG